MPVIIPTITTNDKNVYLKQYALYSTFSKRIHLDICDGIFAPSQTMDVSNAWRQADWAALDLHMMISNPSQALPVIFKIHPSLCIFHAEAGEDLTPTFAALKQAGIKTGLALLKQTYPGNVANYLKLVDHCLIFAGRLGYQGGEADMLQTEKINLVREINPSLEIAWDGGANMSNVRALAHTSLDVINVGSAIATATDPAKTYNDLVAETDKQGVVI